MAQKGQSQLQLKVPFEGTPRADFDAVAYAFDAQGPYPLAEIPERIWKSWLWCQCLVRGRVVRSVTVGGSLQDLPVCGARVHLCEVDPVLLVLKELPDPLILRLRNDLLTELRKPNPLPDPPPDWLAAASVDPSPENLAPRADTDRTRASSRSVAFSP
jgi:hypothetical protein